MSLTTTITTTTTTSVLYDDSLAAVTSSAGINLVLFCVSSIAFDFLVRWSKARSYLLPHFSSEDVLPGYPFGWLRQAWQARHQPKRLTPDAAVVIRFCELGLKFSICGSILDIVLLPMYYTGSAEAEGFNSLSLSNLQDKSARYWGVVAAAYILTAVFSHLLLSEWRHFVTLQRESFLNVSRGHCGRDLAQARRSVMVELIPTEYQSREAVHAFFERLFGPGSVHSCVPQEDTTNLYRGLRVKSATQCCCCCRDPLNNAVDRMVVGADGLLRRDISMQRQPILTLDDIANASNQNLRTLPGVGAVRELGQGVQQLAVGMVQFGQDIFIGHASTSTAFVTFCKAADCAAAEQMTLMHGGAWQTSPAPEPRDLIWHNVSKPLSQLQFRTVVAETFLVLGVLFWSIPVIWIQSIANVGYLKTQIPSVVHFLEGAPVIYTLLTSYLPALALIGLMAILPYVFEIMASRYEGHKTKSEVQRRILNRSFAYQLASLYVTILSGSLIQSLEEILNRPSSILSILSSSLPNVAVYFVTYILARIGTSLPLLLLRPAAPLGCSSDHTQQCQFGYELSSISLVLVIGLTYSFIAPAILPICALYFGIASLVYRWLFTYVYEPEFNCDGMMWHDLFRNVIAGLLLGTLSLVALAAIDASAGQASLLLPLPVWVVLFGGYCWFKLGVPSRRVALADAADMDNTESQHTIEFSEDLYVDPLLKACRSTAVSNHEQTSRASGEIQCRRSS